jgi:extradiol dioxygenase family protein
MDALYFLRLLDDERVVSEIERYKWIESERLGKDIGKERAAWEWIKAYGHIWLKIHKTREYQEAMQGKRSALQTPIETLGPCSTFK